MRRFCLLLAVVGALPLLAAAPPEKNNGRLIVLGIALNQYPDKKHKETVSSYNYCAEGFTQALRQGEPLYRQVETHTVLGRQATRPHCLAVLNQLAHRASRQDLVALGIYGHGFTDPKEGWGIETADKATLWGHEIKTILGRLPCPALVVIETCTSAGFAKSNRRSSPLPANVAALCACRANPRSDNQLSIAVIEGLWGKADFDKDGVVEVAELVRYARLRRQELGAEDKKGKDGEAPLLVEATKGPSRQPLTQVCTDLAAVAVNGEWYQARLLKQKKTENGKLPIHLLGWDSKPGPYFLANEVDGDRICRPGDPPPIKVEVEGRLRLAQLLSAEGDQWKVRYVEGQKKEDTIAKEAVRQLFGSGNSENSGAQKKRRKK